VNSQARSSDIDVVAPPTYKDIKPMGEAIKARRVVIVNLRYSYDSDESRRIKDFMAGAAFVAGARPRALTSDKLVYLLSPVGVDVDDSVLDAFRARDFAPVS
jgi:FtsZ-interacting cell division protein YlmF